MGRFLEAHVNDLSTIIPVGGQWGAANPDPVALGEIPKNNLKNRIIRLSDGFIFTPGSIAVNIYSARGMPELLSSFILNPLNVGPAIEDILRQLSESWYSSFNEYFEEGFQNNV